MLEWGCFPGINSNSVLAPVHKDQNIFMVLVVAAKSELYSFFPQLRDF